MTHDIIDALTAALLRIALAQPDPAERIAMLAIMRDDGHLGRAAFARLCEGVCR